MAIVGYSDLKKLHVGANAIVWSARRDRDDRAVILKIVKGPRPGPAERARFRREAAITRMVQGPGVIEALDFVDEAESMLVLEDFGGRTVSTILREGRMGMEEALTIARAVALTLARLHQAGIVHRDITPANLVVHRRDRIVKLIDFGISSRQKRDSARGAVRLAGTLRYIAPEQTGRMNRSIDYRADYYGLGASLFHMVTGRVPFPGDDPLELVHAHIARVPESAHSIREGVPRMVSAVISKLMQKAPEDRYQGPTALISDLDACLAAAVHKVDDATFQAGEGDIPLGLYLPERLYGRGPQIDALLDAFRSAEAGGRELLLVGGYSGIGKTALVNELQKPIAGTRGHFAGGKFDQYKRGLPYAAIFGAIRGLLRQILSGDDASVALWGERIEAATEGLGALLLEPIPEIASLLSELPPVPELPGGEAEARFDGLMLRLVRSLASRQHPLALFLDDLQWADLPSLRLLARLASDPASSHLLLIGAYRDNEVDDAHPLIITVQGLESRGAPVRQMILGPLGVGDVAELLADALRTKRTAVFPLAALLHQRTYGNPFFLERLLESLYDAGHLRMAPESGGWVWDLEAIQAHAATDDVVAFVSGRLQTLPEAARRALTLGSLLGASFTLRDLAALAEQPLSQAADALVEARARGLLLRIDDALTDEDDVDDGLDPSIDLAYAFLHDRVQQAASEALGPQETMELRLRIARQIAALPDGARAEKLFDQVDHYVSALALLDDPDERRQVAVLNHEAARRAVASGAYAPALRYGRAAMELLPADAWDSDYELALAIHHAAASAAMLAANHDAMREINAVVIAHARTVLDRVPADRTEISARMASNDMAGACDHAVDTLQLLGQPIPRIPTEDQVIAGLVAAQDLVAGDKADRLLASGQADDPLVLQAQAIRGDVFAAAYYGRPSLAPVLGFEMVLGSAHGLTPETAFGLTILGLVTNTTDAIEQGHGYGRLALRVNDLLDDQRLAYRSQHIFHTHCHFWVAPWRECRDALLEIYKGELANGDIEFAAFSAFTACSLNWFLGMELEQTEQTMATFSGAITSLGQETSLLTLKMQHQCVLTLLGRTERRDCVHGPIYDELVMVPEHKAKGDGANLAVFWTTKVAMMVFLGDIERALEAGREYVAAPDGAPSWPGVPQFWYFWGLTCALATRLRPASEHAELLERAAEVHAKMKVWAEHGPANQAHRLALLEAELARIDGDVGRAIDRYEDAIRGARSEGFQQDEALALELSGRFHLDLGHDQLAHGLLTASRAAYTRWGAVAVVERLDGEFSHILASAGAATGLADLATVSTHTSTGTRTTTDLMGDRLDTAALVKAAQALTATLHLDELVERLLKVALQAGGATRASLLLAERDGLVLEAQRDLDGHLRPRKPLAEVDDLPRSVLRFVTRSREPITVDDLSGDARFRDDPALAASGARSALCVPLVHGGRLEALLYLEHDQTRRAFPATRTSLIQTLAAQAAISIDNARLYASLEEQVRDRTKQLVEARTDAENQRDRADRLLYNVLPRRVAEELKTTGRTTPASIDSASVLFTDFQGFTALSATMPPQELLELLERTFVQFDEVMDRHGVEKLKTIGDAYMAVGGAPLPNRTHAVDCVLAALELLDRNRTPFGIRIGIHTGPLIAGVIGKRRLAYDVWGDTVNLAARMESGGEPGRVNISASTYDQVRAFFACEHRGKRAAKGRGEVDMYFVQGIRPELSVDGLGQAPNAAFERLRAELA